MSDSGFMPLFAVLSYSVFGAIHCIAWDFKAHSDTVQRFWRAGSLMITISIPPMLFVGGVIGSIAARLRLGRDSERRFFQLPFVPCALLFVLARILLLSLPFFELNHLSSEALKTISWEDIIPHID